MIYHFADCTLDTDRHSLTRDSIAQHLEPQVFDLLHLLLRHAGNLVSRDLIIQEVWQGRIVSESAISARIADARRAVGDTGKAQSIIRTIPRRGLQLVAPATTDAPAAPSIAQTQHIRFTTADDGTKLAYALTGKGPPMLRVGHFPSSLELDWNNPFERPLFDALAANNTLLRYDHRGCGLSDRDPDALNFELLREDTRTVADAAGFEKFALIGTSGGALTAMHFAAQYPDRVSQLILLGGFVEGRTARGDPSLDARAESIAAMIRDGWNTPGSPFVAAYFSLYFPDASPEIVRICVADLQASCSRDVELKIRALINHAALAPILPHITAPTLVLHSLDDAVHPLSEARKLAQGISGAQLVIFETANHYPLPDTPTWAPFLAEIANFLNQPNHD